MLALYVRDVRLGIRAGGGALVGILFFLAVVAVIPFGVGPDLNLLARIGPAILWIGALLASLLGLDRLFQADRDDGSLDLLIMSGGRHLLALAVLGDDRYGNVDIALSLPEWGADNGRISVQLFEQGSSVFQLQFDGNLINSRRTADALWLVSRYQPEVA